MYTCQGCYHFVFALPRRRRRKASQDAKKGGIHDSSKLRIHWLRLPTAWWSEEMGNVLPTESYVPDSGRKGVERRHSLVYCYRLIIAPKASEQVGGEDSAVVAERNLTYARNQNTTQVRRCVAPGEDLRRATYLIYFVWTHLHIRSILCVTKRCRRLMPLHIAF